MESLSMDSQIQLILSIILLLISVISSISLVWSLFFFRPQLSILPYQFIVALSIYELAQNIANILASIQSFSMSNSEVVNQIISLLSLPTNLSFSFILVSLQFNRFVDNSFIILHQKIFSSGSAKVIILLSVVIFLLRFVLCLLPQFSLQYAPIQYLFNFTSTEYSETLSRIETTIHLFFVSLLLLSLFIFSLLYIFQNSSVISRDENPTLVISILLSIYQSILIVFWQSIILSGGTQLSLKILQFILVFRSVILSLLIISIPRSRSTSILSINRRQSEERTTTSSSNLRLPKDSKENRSGNSNWKKRLTGDLKVANAALSQDKVKYLT